jgi:hypothetical protein
VELQHLLTSRSDDVECIRKFCISRNRNEFIIIIAKTNCHACHSACTARQ